MVAGNLRVIFGAKSIPEVVTIPTMTPCHFQRPGEPLPKRNAFWKAKKLRQLPKDDDQSNAPQITRDDLVRDELDQPAAANQSVSACRHAENNPTSAIITGTLLASTGGPAIPGNKPANGADTTPAPGCAG